MTETLPYYTSIDEMPIWNWEQTSKTGDLKYVFKSCTGKIDDKIDMIWENLQDQCIKEFGLESDFEDQLRIKQNIIDLRYDLILNRNMFNNTLIAIEMADLKALESVKGMKFYELKDHMEKYKGFRIDPKTTTVTEWHYTIKNMKDGQSN